MFLEINAGMYPETALYHESGSYYDENMAIPVEEVDQPLSLVKVLGLGIWLVFCAVGFVVAYWAREPILGAFIAGGATLIGMLASPTFSLSIMMLVLPTGAGIGYAGAFSLEKGVGIALAISFVFFILLRRPDMRIKNKAIWCAIGFFVYASMSSMWGVYLSVELVRALTEIQLLILVLIAYWLLENNSASTFKWAIRAYVLGMISMVLWAFLTGVGFSSAAGKGGRFEATIGDAIDANHMGVLLSVGFIYSIYLMVRDKKNIWRSVYCLGIILLPIMIIKTGSRGTIFALSFTLLSPMLFIRQIIRKPVLFGAMLLVLLLLAGTIVLFMKHGSVDKRVSYRLTNVGYAQDSMAERVGLMKKASETVFRYPIGTAYTGWFQRAGVSLFPHNDFFYALGIYGLPGAFFWFMFIIMTLLTIKRIPWGLEKLYARSLLIFLLITGLSLGQLAMKVYWMSMVIILASERMSLLQGSRTIQATYEEPYEETENTGY